MLRMSWRRFAGFAGVAAVGWALYAALLGYLGGRAFEDNVLWALLTGFGVAVGTFLVVEAARRARSRRQRALEEAAEEPAPPERKAA
jgi:membrane protein DedA with SNARE-associated domain